MRLAVVDIETTGLEPGKAEIIEYGRYDVDREEDGCFLGRRTQALFNCHEPCPPEVIAVHHLTASDLCDQPYCDGNALIDLMSGADVLVAHNAEFEQGFLGAYSGEVPWLCTLKAASRVWPAAPGHTNQVLRYWLGLDLPEAHAMPPHRAAPDAFVTAHILMELLKHASVEDMIAWTKEPRVMPTCPIGKFRGKPWPEVEFGFLRWMLDQASMEFDLKWNAQRELDRRRAAAR